MSVGILKGGVGHETKMRERLDGRLDGKAGKLVPRDATKARRRGNGAKEIGDTGVGTRRRR